MAVSLGFYLNLATGDLIEAIRSLLQTPKRIAQMSLACEALDGKGADRIAGIIYEKMTNHT